MSQTNYGKNLVLQSVIGDDRGALVPATFYVAIVGTALNATDTGSDLDEPTAGEYPGYARVAYANTDARWTLVGFQGTNACVVSFPSSASVGSGLLAKAVVLTSASAGGEVVSWNLLAAEMTVGVGPSVTPRFLPGALRVSVVDAPNVVEQ